MKADLEKLIFYKAGEYMKHRNFSKAKDEYYKILESKEYNEIAALNIARVLIRENDFKTAREFLDIKNPSDIEQHCELMGLLEANEYNFYKSNKQFDKCINLNSRSQEIIYNKAINHILLGNKELSICMLESLKFDKNYYVKSILSLITLYIYYKEYDKALTVLNEINIYELDRENLTRYRILYTYVLYHLDKLNNCDSNTLGKINSYHYSILTSQNDDLLINHITKHFGYENDQKSFIYNTIDKQNLIKITRDKIKMLNPGIHECATTYYIKHNEIIGINNGIPTNTLCAVVVPNTDKIITLYPILLSNDYDQEGYSLKKKGK